MGGREGNQILGEAQAQRSMAGVRGARGNLAESSCRRPVLDQVWRNKVGKAVNSSVNKRCIGLKRAVRMKGMEGELLEVQTGKTILYTWRLVSGR